MGGRFWFCSKPIPLIATEFGFSMEIGAATAGPNDYGNHITKYLEGKGISWMAWVYDPEWGPQLLKSWDGFELTGSGEFIKQALHRPVGK